MQPQVKQRNSNLELYRIIVMLLIVAHHYVVNSGMMEEMAKDPLSSRSIFYYIFGMWGKIGIYRSDTCLYALLAVLAIFFICILIDYVRIHTIEKWTFKIIDCYLKSLLSRLEIFRFE